MSRDGMTREELLDEKQIYEMVQLIKSLPVDLKDDYLVLFIHGFADAWENGVDWVNILEMVGGLAGAIFALYNLFGKVTAGIGAVIGGIAMLVLAFKDAMDNGWNLENTFLAIAGLLAIKVGETVFGRTAIRTINGVNRAAGRQLLDL